MEDCEKRYRYHLWANRKVIEHLKQLPEEVYTQEVESVFPRISQVLEHFYRVDLTWFAALTDESFEQIAAAVPGWVAEVEGISLDQMGGKLEEVGERYLSFLSKVDHSASGMSISHPRFGRLETSVSEMIEHVVNHGTHHRGNISAMLRQLGYANTPTDYILYLYSLGDAE